MDPGSCRSVNPVRVLQTDDQVVDPMKCGFISARNLGPGSTAILGHENPRTPQWQPGAAFDLAEIAFAGTDIEHIGVRRVNRHRVDGDVGDPVGEGSPGLAAVGRFPYAA